MLSLFKIATIVNGSTMTIEESGSKVTF